MTTTNKKPPIKPEGDYNKLLRCQKAERLVFAIIFLSFITFNGCKQKAADNQLINSDFSVYLNLPYSVLTDSLGFLQTRLDSAFGDENIPESYKTHYEFWDNFIDFAQKNNDKRLLAAAKYRKIQITRYYHRDNAQAQQQYSELADYCNQTGFKELEIICYQSIAYIYSHSQNYQKCFEICDKMEPLVDNISYQQFPNKAGIYLLIGAYYFFAKEYRVSLRYFEKALNAPKIPMNYWVILQCTNNIGLCYANLDQNDKAVEWYQKILDDPFFKEYDHFPDWEVIARTNISRVQMAQGNYSAAIPAMKHAIAHFGQRDTSFCCGAAIDLVESFVHLKQTDSATRYVELYLSRQKIDNRHINSYYQTMSLYYQSIGNLQLALACKDSLQMYEQAGKQKLAAADILFEKQEQKKAEIQHNEKMLLRNKNIISVAVVLCVILIVVLTVWFFYSRKIHKKNVALVQKILEQEKLLQQTADTATAGSAHIDTPLQTPPDEIFLRVEKLMIEDMLFTSEHCNWKTLATAAATNENYLRTSIRTHTGLSVNGYINAYRCKYANTLLLRPAKEMTVEQIAFDSGFSSRITFYNAYSKHYKISPNEFRKIAQETV
ncbi:MAG: AraC family transcriptional regulator [Prevotellaceae bacterium]|jgi:AraC-like DNA-binding protein|nr:AraC family transcriptional regulator [Prevotellaceae bacterium]